jgi:hypothetical protein
LTVRFGSGIIFLAVLRSGAARKAAPAQQRRVRKQACPSAGVKRFSAASKKTKLPIIKKGD